MGEIRYVCYLLHNSYEEKMTFAYYIDDPDQEELEEPELKIV